VADILRTHFFDPREDARLDERNIHFWRALSGHVLADQAIEHGASILDVGSHQGGLLAMMIERFKPSRVIGIEPLTSARQIAERRLGRYDVDINLLDGDGWPRVADESMTLVLSHEVMQYISDVRAIMVEVHRVLAPGGFAYIVLGCHIENPLWPTWRRELEAMGHVVYDHAPLELMAAGAEAGLAPSVRPLRDSGWVHYDPTDSGAFTYPSMTALLDHHYKHKLLFRFERRP
jgi:SAM-dependent methyltransferase